MSLLSRDQIIGAYVFSKGNKDYIERDTLEKAGCFSCLKIFAPTEVTEYVDDPKGPTAVCPYCGEATVVPEGGGRIITDEFLEAMKKAWVK